MKRNQTIISEEFCEKYKVISHLKWVLFCNDLLGVENFTAARVFQLENTVNSASNTVRGPLTLCGSFFNLCFGYSAMCLVSFYNNNIVLSHWGGGGGSMK